MVERQSLELIVAGSSSASRDNNKSKQYDAFNVYLC